MKVPVAAPAPSLTFRVHWPVPPSPRKAFEEKVKPEKAVLPPFWLRSVLTVPFGEISWILRSPTRPWLPVRVISALSSAIACATLKV
ncbi:hypothetical protein LDDCCGHA_1321 [Methylobacterium oxalidis]|nr:hypothetical protein LDDCCGHA_1321 [Methylobacterium oxalidis]